MSALEGNSTATSCDASRIAATFRVIRQMRVADDESGGAYQRASCEIEDLEERIRGN